MTASIHSDATGFRLTVAPSPLKRFFGGKMTLSGSNWTSVKSAWAGKRDEVAVDTVFVALELDGGSRVVVTEDDEGWTEFLRAAQQRLPGFPEPAQWLAQVTQPPFAPNTTVLFTRN